MAAALGVAGAYVAGLIDEATANTALAVLGFGSIATLRAGIVNSLAQAKDEPLKVEATVAPDPVSQTQDH